MGSEMCIRDSPSMAACSDWLARCRGHDIVAIAAQEASYPHSKRNLSPASVSERLGAAGRGGIPASARRRDRQTAPGAEPPCARPCEPRGGERPKRVLYERS